MKMRHKVLILILAAVPLLWVVDAALDFFWFYDRTFSELLLTNVPAHEIFVRALESGIVLLFGFIIVKLVGDQEKTKESAEQAEHFLNSTLDALSAHLAILDENGTILNVNGSWRRFADENGLAWNDYGIGRNYLQLIEEASGDSMERARDALEGIKELLAGKQDHFQLEYPCHSSDTKRWFQMHGTSFDTRAGKRVVLAHENITQRRQAEERTRQLNTSFAPSATSTRLSSRNLNSMC
ncbi:MAG: PAS domain-containing protein [Candidatus Brocadiia bacterium]